MSKVNINRLKALSDDMLISLIDKVNVSMSAEPCLKILNRDIGQKDGFKTLEVMYKTESAIHEMIIRFSPKWKECQRGEQTLGQIFKEFGLIE